MSDSDRAVLSVALQLLARRDFSTALLQRRLVRKGHSAQHAAAACERCVELGYLDDRTYGVGRAADMLQRKPSGRRALLHDLRREGLPRTMTEQIAAEVYGEAGGEQVVLGEALRRWIARRGDPTDWPALKRCADHLGRRGFAASAIQAALSPWLDEVGRSA